MRLVNRTFNELQTGDVAELRRLISADDLYVFAAASGNHNPMHLTDSDLDGDGRNERVAQGMFVASMISAVLGTQLPGAGTLYRRQSGAETGYTVVNAYGIGRLDQIHTGPGQGCEQALRGVVRRRIIGRAAEVYFQICNRQVRPGQQWGRSQNHPGKVI